MWLREHASMLSHTLVAFIINTLLPYTYRYISTSSSSVVNLNILMLAFLIPFYISFALSVYTVQRRQTGFSL